MAAPEIKPGDLLISTFKSDFFPIRVRLCLGKGWYLILKGQSDERGRVSPVEWESPLGLFVRSGNFSEGWRFRVIKAK